MNKLAAFFALLIISSFCFGQEIYSRVAIPRFENMYAEIGALGIAMDHTHSVQGRVVVEINDTEIQTLRDNNIRFSIMIRDVAQHYVNQVADLTRDGAISCGEVPELGEPENFELGTYAGFHRYDEMLAELDYMAAAYPNLITTKAPISDFETEENRPIIFVKISDNPNTDEDEKTIMYNAIHHAREPAAMSQLIYFMWWLLENYESNPEVQFLLDNTEIVFVPCMNPDGYLYNETTNPDGGGMWRKNRKDNGDGTYGVDLNRNYGEYWGNDDIGSSPQTSASTYRGTGPFSEPETQAIKWLCEEYDFELAFNNHAYGDLLINPGDNEPTGLTEDSTLFRQMGSYLSRFDTYDDGTGIETVGYFANGVSDDWMYAPTEEKPKSFTYTPEAGNPEYGFWPPLDHILPICRQYLIRNLDFLRMIHPMAAISLDKQRYFDQLTGHAVYELTYLGQTAGDITVSLTPPLEIISWGDDKVYSDLEAGDIVVDSIAYELGDVFSPGQFVDFEVKATASEFKALSNIQMMYGTEVVIFEDDCETLDNWDTSDTFTGAGFVLSNTAVSGNHSFTDPEMESNWGIEEALLELTQEIDLTGYLRAQLEFDIRYAINANSDFLTVRAYTLNGGGYFDLCGYYTERGFTAANNSPHYDGYKHHWVRESISLDEFINDQIQLSFRMDYSSGAIEDGVYIDNIRIIGITGIDSHIDKTEDPELTIFPNPASETITITGELVEGIQITDAVGRVIHESSSTANSLQLDVSSWARGAYVCRLNNSGKAVKLIVR